MMDRPVLLNRTLAASAALSTLLAFAGLPAAAHPAGETAAAIHAITGHASWYGPGFQGRRTASGERYDMNGHTAAHKTLPFGTKVRVTNLRTGESVVVRINDRGPFVRGREIDLSKGAAAVIGLVGQGVAQVRLEVLG